MAGRRRHRRPLAGPVLSLLVLAAAACSSPAATLGAVPATSPTTSASDSPSPSDSGPSTSSPPDVTVPPVTGYVAPTATTLTLDPGTFTALAPTAVHVRVHAKGSVSAPTGTVTVLDSGRPVGSTGVTAATGGSVDVVLTLHAGVHALTARYSGDRDHQASVSTRTALAVRPVATTTTVTAQRNAKNVKQFRLAVRVRTHVASLFAPGVLTVDVGGRRYSFRLDAQGHVAFHLVLSRGVTYVVVATYPGAPDFGASSARTAFTV